VPPATGENRDSTETESAIGTPHSALLSGFDSLGEVVLADQSSLGRTPRSNPAVYIGAFESIRELFAATEDAKRRGLNASAFSFNSSQGQCGKCPALASKINAVPERRVCHPCSSAVAGVIAKHIRVSLKSRPARGYGR
jgi:excinuclease UvrABC ATPase subunit